MRLVIAFATYLVAAPALASGGLWCMAEGESSQIGIQSGVSRGLGGQLFDFNADVEITDPQVRPDLRSSHFAREHVAQYWLDETNLMLVLYRETEDHGPHAYVEIVVKTRFVELLEEYSGDYTIAVFDVGNAELGDARIVELAGPISCFVE